YLLGLAGFLMIYTLTNTWAYFQQSDLTGHQLQDRAARTSFLANIDIAVNTITVLIQVFLTGRLMKWFGVGITLVLMPLLSAVGWLGISRYFLGGGSHWSNLVRVEHLARSQTTPAR